MDIVSYKRKRRPRVDRSTLSLTKVDQTTGARRQPDNKHSVIKVKLTRDDGSYLKNYPLQLTCYKLGKTFEGKTGSNGIANFFVPYGHDYEVDIDGIESFTWCDLGDYPSVRTEYITYEPTTFPESEKDGYIVQTIPQDPKPTSTRARIKLKVLGGEKRRGERRRISAHAEIEQSVQRKNR